MVHVISARGHGVAGDAASGEGTADRDGGVSVALLLLLVVVVVEVVM